MGNTITIQRKDARITVHPHAYGEHDAVHIVIQFSVGSSPRIWGTPLDLLRRVFFCRFIPTHMGNTCTYQSKQQVRPVHPHAYGEHDSDLARRVVEAGSSPRIWGTRIDGQRICTYYRFIPTHMGNTSSANTIN